MPKTKAPPPKQIHKRPPGVAPWLSDFRIQSLVLVVVGLTLYANSFANGYALDDGIVIQKNEYVQQGLSGLGRIFSTDIYQSFYTQMGSDQQLSGGRYRPLSVATFALEQQLFGSNDKVKPDNDVAMVRHFVSVCLYLLSIILLLQLLRSHVLPESHFTAFLACLLFLIHPLHTEVVANVKSRDEILSFLFIVLTLKKACDYRDARKPSQLVSSLVFYFLALLSKEYALTLVGLIPLLLFIAKKENWSKSLKAVLPFLAIALLYMLLRIWIVGLGNTAENGELLNNPYKLASGAEKWATKIVVLTRYLWLLFFPYPLSYDYSYKAIPYTNFNDLRVWWSIVLHLSMIVGTIILARRRSILAFALAFYLVHLFLISNLLIDIGATMGERLVYHSSFGFALTLAILIGGGIQRVVGEQQRTVLAICISLLLIVPCGAIVIPRNAEWKNDTTLYLADVEKVPDSALATGNAGKAYLDLAQRPENRAQLKELAAKSIPYSQKAVGLHNGHLNGYLNLGVASFILGDYEGAELCWNTAQRIYPDHPFVMANLQRLALVYSDKANAAGANSAEAIRWLEKAVGVDGTNADLWVKLGIVYSRAGNVRKARSALNKALEVKPGYPEAERELSQLPAE